MRASGIIILSILSWCTAAGQVTVDVENCDSVTAAEEDARVRENPVIVFDGGEDEDITVPSFVHTRANAIKLNGADWGGLRAAARNASKAKFNIVQIGDSHIQAGISAEVVRERLQLDFGDGGRGLLSPLRLCGTNQPWDYKFESDNSWIVDKVMKAPWVNPMGFNGISLTMKGSAATISLSTKESDETYCPFCTIELMWSGDGSVISVTDAEGLPLDYDAVPTSGGFRIRLSEPVTAVKIGLRSSGHLTLHGAAVYNDRPGAVFHTIGNNGATFQTYNRIGTTAKGVSELSPDLIVVSLGTNDAFGRFDPSSFRSQMDTFIRKLRKENPEAQILLVTPMECQKRSSVRTGRRKRRRRVTRYSVNSNILPIRNEILRYGAANHIAVYDWYAVAGGAGASSKWLGSALLGGDRVHHTAGGYRLAGKLLYDALIKCLTESER